MKIRHLLPALLIFSAAHAALAAAPASQSSAMPSGLGGGGPLEVSAQQSLEWHQTENMYLARGDAKAVRGDVTIAADELAAYQRAGKDGKTEIFKLTARGKVRITTKDHTIEGDEGYYDADRRVAVLTGEHLRFSDPTETVTAKDALEYWQDNMQAVARGNAVAVKDGRRVTADKMTAQFRNTPKNPGGAKASEGGMELQQLTAEGNVVITTDTDVARGDKGVYDMNRNVAVLTGHVKVTRGASQLEGAVAEVDFRTGISRMTASNTGDNRIRALFVPGENKSGAVKLP